MATSVTELVSALEIAVWLFLAGCVWRCLRSVMRESEPESDDTPYT